MPRVSWIVALAACSSRAAPLPPDPEVGPDAAELVEERLPAQGELVVLSLNLHCLSTAGTSYPTNAARFSAIAGTIAEERVDAVLAQEVCASATEDARTLLRAALEAATGTSWSVVDLLAHRAWEGTPDEADEYVAVFTRRPPSSPTTVVHRAQAGLQRVVVGATVTSTLATATGEPVPVRIYSAHLDHADAAARAAQARELASLAMVESDDPSLAIELELGGVSIPAIVGGDFNARHAEAAPQAMQAFGFVDAARGAATTRIDHVFAHRSAPLATAHTSELFVGAAAVSDHPGVLVRFVPAAPTGVRLTRIIATGAQPRPLAVRGDTGPLSWTAGWPAFARGAELALVTSELPPTTLEYKFLRDDVDWQLGDNAIGTGEADNLIQPTFP